MTVPLSFYQQKTQQWFKPNKKLGLYIGISKYENLAIEHNGRIEYITNNDLDNVTIRISDCKIKFLDMNYSQPLTYKCIYECLIKFFNNENTVDEIINFIKTERNIKTIKEIKRFKN